MAMKSESNRPFDQSTTLEHPNWNRGDAPFSPIGHTLVIPCSIQEEIATHLARALPNEGCGLLAGRVGRSGLERAVRYFPGTNIDHSPVRYTMEPAEVIGAMRTTREAEWTLAAIVHSHPHTAPVPSATDLAEAYYPNTRLLILSFADAAPEVRGWRLDRAIQSPRFFECALILPIR